MTHAPFHASVLRPTSWPSAQGYEGCSKSSSPDRHDDIMKAFSTLPVFSITYHNIVVVYYVWASFCMTLCWHFPDTSKKVSSDVICSQSYGDHILCFELELDVLCGDLKHGNTITGAYHADITGKVCILRTEINKHFQLLFATTLTLTLRHSDVTVVCSCH